MNKTLTAILHYNTTRYTDTLYEMLNPYKDDVYDLEVIDNGSDPSKTSKYTTLRLDTNVYYGGGLDVTMQYFIENKQYDSMILLNSDLIVHGYNFIRGLRKALFSDDKLMIASGCVIQPEKDQCYWEPVHCWGATEVRTVPWVDFQCCLLKREFVEHVKGFGSRFGWVQDVMAGIICEEQGWKIGVCDWIPVIHFGNGSVKDNSSDPIISRYNQLAEGEMYEYFERKGIMNKAMDMRQLAKQYKYKI